MLTLTKSLENLSLIPHYRIHPELLPFIGSDYEKYRILFIGESHYINQPRNTSNITLNDFFDWWDAPCQEVLIDSEEWVNTKQVIENYMSGKRGSYGIFTNVIKSFSKVVLDKEIKHISLETKQLYDNFAFMNFFQMPSLYIGMKYWDSLEKSAKYLGDKSLAGDVWNKCIEVSTEIVDSVIDILKPRVVVFTSISAGTAYRETSKANYSGIEFVHTSHPGAPYSWNKPLSSLNGETGKNVLEEALMLIFR